MIRRRWIIIGIGVILVLVVGGGFYYGYKSGKLKTGADVVREVFVGDQDQSQTQDQSMISEPESGSSVSDQTSSSTSQTPSQAESPIPAQSAPSQSVPPLVFDILGPHFTNQTSQANTETQKSSEQTQTTTSTNWYYYLVLIIPLLFFGTLIYIWIQRRSLGSEPE